MLSKTIRHLLVLIALLASFAPAAAYAVPTMGPGAVAVTASEMDCAGMEMASANSDAAPCVGMTLECIATMGCVSAPLVAAEPLASALEVLYLPVRYVTADETFASATVEPEVFPPIA